MKRVHSLAYSRCLRRWTLIRLHTSLLSDCQLLSLRYSAISSNWTSTCERWANGPQARSLLRKWSFIFWHQRELNAVLSGADLTGFTATVEEKQPEWQQGSVARETGCAALSRRKTARICKANCVSVGMKEMDTVYGFVWKRGDKRQRTWNWACGMLQTISRQVCTDIDPPNIRHADQV